MSNRNHRRLPAIRDHALMAAAAPPGLPILLDFWTAAYQAIDD
jgi:hypothetical protein